MMPHTYPACRQSSFAIFFSSAFRSLRAALSSSVPSIEGTNLIYAAISCSARAVTVGFEERFAGLVCCVFLVIIGHLQRAVVIRAVQLDPAVLLGDASFNPLHVARLFPHRNGVTSAAGR